MPIRHYRRSAVAMFVAALILLAGFGTGWYAADQLAKERDVAQHHAVQAQKGEAQALSNVRAAKTFLRNACNQSLQSACHMLQALEDLPTPAQAKDSEQEIQEPEIQDPEIQDPEIQEPDTFCRKFLLKCKGPSGLTGPVGPAGPIGPVGPLGPMGEPGKGVRSVSCDDGVFTVTYTDDTSSDVEGSSCSVKDPDPCPAGGSIQQITVFTLPDESHPQTQSTIYACVQS